MPDPADILQNHRRIHVVGCSATPGKDAHEVPAYMQRHGYDIIPVNPTADEILGQPAYPTLADAPGPVDFVNVFRPSPETPDIARQAAEAGARVLWLQLGIQHPEARRIAHDAGIQYVEDRCVLVEHRRIPSKP